MAADPQATSRGRPTRVVPSATQGAPTDAMMAAPQYGGLTFANWDSHRINLGHINGGLSGNGNLMALQGHGLRGLPLRRRELGARLHPVDLQDT